MANITNATISLDQEKFLAARLIQRSMIKVVCASVCDPVKQPEGAGLTANFVRYQRMTVPLVSLSEGVAPTPNSFSLTNVAVTVVQWGDVLQLTDVAQLTAKHPLMQQAIELLSDSAQRVIDREIQIVWLAGTNVQYYDGSIASRALITNQARFTDAVFHKARTSLIAGGAPPRGGPAGGIILGNAGGGNEVMRGEGEGNFAKKAKGMEGLLEESDGSITQGQSYVLICNQYVSADVQQVGTSLGSWIAVQMYNNARAIYNSEVGTWLGLRVVESNFLPIFQLLGNNTVVVNTGASFGTNTPVVTNSANGGALAANATFGFLLSMKDQTRGFEEFISIVHTIQVGGGNTNSISFAFPVNNGFVYNLYFDNNPAGGSTTTANLQLVQANIASGTTVIVTTAQQNGTTPPAPPPSNGINVHASYVHGNESCNLVALQNLQMYISLDKATTIDPLLQLRTAGYKMMFQAMIRDQLRMLRVETASAYF